MALSEAALLACYQRLQTPLFNVLYRWLWHTQDCEDVMHDAYLRIWDQRQRIDATKLDALVYTTALNLAKNKLRWRSLWRFGVRDEEASDDARLDGVQDRKRLKSALEALDTDSRNLVLLSECAGFTTDELVAFFGWPAGTVASRKHRALAQLRAALREGER